ncbi:hypothetical protein [Anaerocolumna chitinilytica]|uniref:Uncharacterized protein n=1 Tax=Anaerocolumna chitinilytica TaxID=1727145 RepID=A0A7I8DF85_9FIRM|nr:hypothetical protein [Anaerocolumna chitinilytica]BCJ97052.1 hypothetical protein bsdcttw_00930 [Anaerocolumna chitinilytica]
MRDSFNINTVGIMKNFDITMNEVSDISNIIRQMIVVKNDKTRTIKKQTLPYSIEDKILLNNIPRSLADLIKRRHIDAYDIVEEAIKNLAEYDACLREDLYDFYYETYVNILINLELDSDDLIKIKEKSGEVYRQINLDIKNELFEGKLSSIPENKIDTYISAITSYVFYKCKFLIPIE